MSSNASAPLFIAESLPANASDYRSQIVRRLSQVLLREISSLDTEALRQLATEDDATAMADLALRQLSTSPLSADRRTRMILLGHQRFNALLEEAGGVYTLGQAAELTGRTTAALRKAVQRKQLLAFKRGNELVFPILQFRDNEVIAGLGTVLTAMPETISSQGAVRFFLTGIDTGNGQRISPIELLRNGERPETVAQWAREDLQ